jgi:hypothetical protein
MNWELVKQELEALNGDAYNKNMLLQKHWSEIEKVYEEEKQWTKVAEITGFKPKALRNMAKKQASKSSLQGVQSDSVEQVSTSVEQVETSIVEYKESPCTSLEQANTSIGDLEILEPLLRRLEALETQMRALQEVSSDVSTISSNLPIAIHNLPTGEEKQSTYLIQTQLLDDLRGLCSSNRVPIKAAVNLALKEFIQKYQDK